MEIKSSKSYQTYIIIEIDNFGYLDFGYFIKRDDASRIWTKKLVGK